MGEKADEAFEGSPQLPPPIPYGPCTNIRSKFRWDFCSSPGVSGPQQTVGGTELGPSGPGRTDPIAHGPENCFHDFEKMDKDQDLVETGVHLGPIQVLGHVRRSRNNRRSLVRSIGVLLHVLRKIRLLSVTLATVGADVCLYMLRLLVLGDVLEEGLLVGEALVAGVALVRLVSLVAPRVGLQVGQLGERLRATWQETLRKQL